ncbi:MAG TPA: MerC domain-containing protein [Allosphingosinicella sp.]|jgi:hypothetical protein
MRRSAAAAAAAVAGSRSAWLDVLGIGTAAACLVHCLLLPLLFALLPSLSSALSLPEEVHLALFAFAVPASGGAMLRGYRAHRVIHPAFVATLGVTGLGLGALGGFEPLIETAITVAASLLLAAAHLLNWRLSGRIAPCRG